MVYLNRIYTKYGDSGQTQLGDGQAVPKTSLRVAAMGDVDELNCLLGVVLASWSSTSTRLEVMAARLSVVQNQLFDLGADVCLPETPETTTSTARKLQITSSDVARLESWIDDFNAHLEPLTSFILPGGSPMSAGLHLARASCRRAERTCWGLHAAETVNVEIMIYLNRLSDLLFVLARLVNVELGRSDVLWQPGLVTEGH